MKKFTHVEDYIEFIAGARDISGNLTYTNFFSSSLDPVISLARYDISVIQNMTAQFMDNVALTVRQAELACKIVLKYEKQLASKGVDISSVKQPTYRIPLRQLDYNRKMYIQDDEIFVQFPFKSSLIEQLREFAKHSQGHCRWNKELKIWQAALTEYNINWLYTWAVGLPESDQFIIDPQILTLFQQMLELERKGYSICLKLGDNELYIDNCPDTLAQYIKDKHGGFGTDNLLHLADIAPILGYKIDGDISQALIEEGGVKFYNLVCNKEVKLNTISPSYQEQLSTVFDYIEYVQRWPAVVFEPDTSNSLFEYLRARYPANLIGSTQLAEYPITEETKYIHTIRPITDLEKIPIIITKAAMLFGGNRQTMFQRAEKVVYSTTDVYNRDKSKRVRDIGS